MLDSILTEEGQYPKQSLPTKSSSSSIDKSQQGQSQYSYSKKSLLNILLVILTSIQITLIFHSRVYINKDLVRSFLSFYVDISQQPEIFNGQSFTIQLQNISELQANIKFALQKLSDPQNRSLLNIDFSSSPLKLRISYHPQIIQYYNISQFTIDPTIGIVQPFQLDNLTDIQMFLLKVNHFELFIDNIHITTEELSEKYSHRVIYSYQQRSQIKINYYFDVFKIISINLDQDIPETFQLFNLKIFYFVIILFACINLYFEIAYIKMTIIQFYHNYNGNQSSKISKRLKWSDIINIFQVELIFSILANIMQIISNIYLFVGRKHEYIIGIGCLFGWMTIFGTLKHYKKFILMYELIKLSIRKVLEFLLSFMVIFMGYCFLGMCLFPKVKYFSSLSYSVTTLVAIMAGDSIDLFTTSLTLKYSTILSIAYIFIYVLLFMHAIHNTLTSIIKQFFIIQKIGLVKIQKLKKGHQNYIYLSEKPIQNQQIKKNLPIKLTQTFQKQIYKIKKQSKLKDCNKRMREIILNLQNMLINEKWQILDAQFQTNQAFKLELESRIMKINHLIHKIQKKQSQNLHQI